MSCIQCWAREMAISRRKTDRLEAPLEPELALLWWLILALVVLQGLTACSRSAVSDRIGEQARSTGVIDITKAADFAWTQVHVYTPYSTQRAVCKDLGKLAPDCLENSPAHVSEGEYLLVFINNGKAVQYVPHSRHNGNFQTSTGVLILQRNAAVLDVISSKSPHQGGAIYLQVRAQVRP